MDNLEYLETKLKKNKENLQLINNKKIKADKIDDIFIDTDLPLEERIYDFFNKINNPYIIKVGNILVEMEFTDDTKITPIECIDNALINDYKSRITAKV